MYGRLLPKYLVAYFIVPPALELVHIGKKEIQQRIDSMEAAYSQPITWSASADSAVPSSQWGDNILVFSAIKKSLQICRSGVAGSRDGDRDLPYYPTRYFHRQVVNWMVENRQKVFVYMDSALRATYGVADPNVLHGGPLSYRDYLHNLLRRDFWGDEIVLWAILMMWGLKVTVLNSKTLQEYHIGHNSAFKHVDVGLVYNSYSHYSAAGRSIVRQSGYSYWSYWSIVVTCYIL